MNEILPAILTNDIQDFERKLIALKGLVHMIQIDIMDGIFVPNKTVTLQDVFKIDIPFFLEIHLMVQYPKEYLQFCHHENVKRIIIHSEAEFDISDIKSKNKNSSCELGIALNPETPVEKIASYIHEIDCVLLMTVTPGEQGQTFQGDVLSKIDELRRLRKDLVIGIDGGVNLDNIDQIKNAHANYVAVGSAIFQAEDIQKRLLDFREHIKK